LSESLKESVFGLCNHVAGSRQIVAACFYGSFVCGYADKESDVNVLLILDNSSLHLNNYFRSTDGVVASILTVDRGAFERDVEQGWLGEFVAEKLLVPFEPLINGEYLRLQEVKIKKRTISELLENLVLEFPELSSELLIRKEYFMNEVMMQRARLFPLISYTFLNMLAKNLRRRNVELMMKGYKNALEELAKEKKITFSNGYVKITRKYIDAFRRQKPRLPVFLRSIRRAAFLHILSIFSKKIRSLKQDQRIFMKAHQRGKTRRLVFQPEETKKYLLMPTPHGLVAFSDKSTIQDFVKKNFPDGKSSDMKIEGMGGVLNDVYLLTLQRNHEERRFVVKKFKDWSGFKWFPLMLWSLGTKTFAVLGRSRLEREYAINQFLHSQGFPVPKILYISLQKRLIFEDFIEGEEMVETIRRIISSKEKATKEVALVERVGRTIAEAHKLGVSLGDCKPENFIVTKEEKTFFVDLEQAARNGNQAWDVAEFLYYSGHYVSPISSAKAANIIAENFVAGYLGAGGRKETVKKAASTRYARVFSVFTPPHVIVAISNICRKRGKD
jgi:tRNA A-37 threonylcarbamoyl transferase component Bud32/predicted nucleotidyltransferase